MSLRVLIWSSDKLQARYLEQILTAQNFSVELYPSFVQLKKAASELGSRPAALMVSLVQVSDPSYRQIHQLHAAYPYCPVLVLTGQQQPEIHQAVLAAGADDCLALPIDAAELVSLLQARLRRVSAVMRSLLATQQEDILTFGSLVLLPDRREVQLAGQVLKLSKAEYSLMSLLARRANQLVTRQELYSCLWQDDEPVGSRRLDNFILALRKKLPLTSVCELQTFYGEGYGLKLS